ILQPHFRATALRVRAVERVIVSHDSSLLSFGPVPRGDLDVVGRGTSYGFNVHLSLAVAGDDSRVPLGVLAASTYRREFGRKRAPASKRKQDPHNVMRRWGEHVELVRERVGQGRNIIHVMDREADDYALLAELNSTEERFVVRQAVDRR